MLDVYKPTLNSRRLDDMRGGVAGIGIGSCLLVASQPIIFPISESWCESSRLINDNSLQNRYPHSDASLKSHHRGRRQSHQDLEDAESLVVL
jgi:hypothetical protein